MNEAVPKAKLTPVILFDAGSSGATDQPDSAVIGTENEAISPNNAMPPPEYPPTYSKVYSIFVDDIYV